MKRAQTLLREHGPLLLMLALVTGVSWALYARRILTPTDNDYGSHIEFAYRMLRREELPAFILAHPLYQAVIAGLYWISRAKLGLWHASVLALTAANVALSALVYAWLGDRPGRWSNLWRAALAGSLAFVGPVMLLAPLDGRFYFGYIGLTSYHNPTVHILRPLAVASWMVAARFALPSRRGWKRWGWAALSAALVLAGALAKPSWAVCLLPAILALAAWRWLRREPVDWVMVLAGVTLPAVAALAWQAGVTYLLPADSGGILIRPFAVEAAYSGHLVLKFLLSILFPLAALELSRGKLPRDPAQALAWLAFAAGVAQMYLLAEGGERLMDGNFRWGAQISLFVLFAATLRWVWRSEAPARKTWPAWAAYAAHVAGGVAYAAACWLLPGYG